MDTGTPPMEPVEGPGITYSLDQHAFVMAGRDDAVPRVISTMLHMEEHEFEFVLRASLTPRGDGRRGRPTRGSTRTRRTSSATSRLT